MSTEDQSERVSLAVVATVIGVLLISVVIYAVRFISGQDAASAGGGAAPAAVSTGSSAGEHATAPGAIGLAGNAQKITLSGAVPDEATKARLLKPARVLWGKDNVVDQLTVAAGAPAVWWQSRPVDVLARLKQLGSFDLQTSAEGMKLTGVAPSAAVRSATGTAAPGWIASQLKSDVALTTDANAGTAGAAAASDNLLDERIEFASGSSTLPEEAKSRLNDIAGLLKDDDRTIVITGHTDNQGDEAANQKLSLERAESVRAYLTGQGVPQTRLQAAGAGSSVPVADNASAEGRQRNRRITFAVAAK
ncbi:OmpA family protein [Ralstonia insidiosa]|jgi:OOP family OmpA-OmpF porin|uniref:Uncharacterized protein n=1 Tax=Ralstonia insidiosa TaxID=190721 RepID=A0A191ZT64_9RALS|nr:OmpA family protein [Ralstonia insidiosa]ANJ71293.1 hypothetical protein A9Y76_01810 [Ralstonia insidiosa]KAB0471879.1 OmpA family protein [Ralstonia insidiosa]MBY4908557.1 OmpA family protein [Ralstonia insidiosa]